MKNNIALALLVFLGTIALIKVMESKEPTQKQREWISVERQEFPPRIEIEPEPERNTPPPGRG